MVVDSTVLGMVVGRSWIARGGPAPDTVRNGRLHLLDTVKDSIIVESTLSACFGAQMGLHIYQSLVQGDASISIGVWFVAVRTAVDISKVPIILCMFFK